jgi:hypothetical protein
LLFTVSAEAFSCFLPDDQTAGSMPASASGSI